MQDRNGDLINKSILIDNEWYFIYESKVTFIRNLANKNRPWYRIEHRHKERSHIIRHSWSCMECGKKVPDNIKIIAQLRSLR